MPDDKRFLRKLKQQIKKNGSRKRQHWLKNPDAEFDSPAGA